MANLYPKGHSPAATRISLRDGAGNAGERPGVRVGDPVLSTIGWTTRGIRLTADTDVSAGEASVYNFGPVTTDSVGRYLFRAQSAADGDEGTHPLGAVEYLELEIRQDSAGVFEIAPVTDLSSLTADGDELATDPNTNMAKAVWRTDADTITWVTTDGDSDVTFTVMTTALAATFNAHGSTVQGGTPEGGDLCIVEARSTTTEVWEVTRIS